jgi:hypothetical protein
LPSVQWKNRSSRKADRITGQLAGWWSELLGDICQSILSIALIMDIVVLVVTWIPIPG